MSDAQQPAKKSEDEKQVQHTETVSVDPFARTIDAMTRSQKRVESLRAEAQKNEDHEAAHELSLAYIAITWVKKEIAETQKSLGLDFEVRA